MAISVNFLNLWDFQNIMVPPQHIPTPTPAPDRAGPVTCLGGPVASGGPFNKSSVAFRAAEPVGLGND